MTHNLSNSWHVVQNNPRLPEGSPFRWRDGTLLKISEEFGKWLRSFGRPGTWYAGIQGLDGARNGSLQECLEYGYDGCLFFLPTNIDLERSHMETYIESTIGL